MECEGLLLVYLNGDLVDGEKATVSIWDSGYLYGEGIFTTLRLYNGLAIDARAHHQRLHRQTNLLNLPFNLSEDAMIAAINELVAANDLAGIDTRVRISISRSGDPETPFPLNNLDNIEPTILITTGHLPPTLGQWQQDGIAVITLGPNFLRGHLPHLKTMNALPTLMAMRRAQKAGAPEALLINHEDQLLEGIVSNVFLVHQGRLLTPVADGRILPGRTRERVISSAAHLEMEIDEKILSRANLHHAQEIFITNSVREIVPVISVDRKTVGSGLPGPITRRLQDQYRSDINTGYNL
jgi:branched-chain amino acid aminotransferase